MEILKGHTSTVKFVVPSNLPQATIKVYKGETQLGATATVAPSDGVASFVLPYSAVAEEGKIEVVLSFVLDTVNYSQEKKFDVVAPYLDIYEVKELLGTADDKEARTAEAAARHIINAHCGQDFGKVTGSFVAKGTGSTSLALPRRLISMTDINGFTDLAGFIIDDAGYYLRYHSWGVPPVKADYYGLHMHVGGVIHNPNNVKWGVFRKGYQYEINGVWGFESVPESVREAAKLLIGVYADEDSEYRDRYLTSMTAADWRIQFNEGAFTHTGHVRADQLLSDHVLRRGWAVL